MSRPSSTTNHLILLTIFTMAMVVFSVQTDGADRPLRVVVPDALSELDPHLDPTAVGSAIFGNMFEALLSIDAKDQGAPILAIRWERTDFKTWRFELRQGVRFHNGKNLTSADVVFSILRARNHEKSIAKVLLTTIAQVIAEDSHTIRIELNQLDAVFLQKISMISIVPQDSLEHIIKPIGTGPYRMISYTPERSLTLGAFKEYWGVHPTEKQVEILFVGDRSTALKRLLTGDVDIVSALSPEHVKTVEQREDLWVSSALGSMVFVLGINANQSPFDNPILREAADFALDRQALAREVFVNYARPAGQLVNPMARGYAPRVEPVTRDLVRAKALIASVAGAEGIPFTLEFKDGNDAIVKVIKHQLDEAGFRVELKPQIWRDLLSRYQEGQFQAGSFTWRNDPQDAGSTFDLIVHSGSPSTARIGIASPENDRLIEACHTVPDTQSRLALLSSIAERLAQRRTLLPLVWSMDLYGVRRDIKWEPPTSGEIRLSTISRRSQ